MNLDSWTQSERENLYNGKVRDGEWRHGVTGGVVGGNEAVSW